MRRREFVALVGFASLAQGLESRAQGSDRIRRIGFLGNSNPLVLDPRQIAGFKQGLAENGLVEGRNVSVEFRWAEGQLDRLPRLAAELAQLDLDAIVTAGPQAARALMLATKKTPIVMAIVSDPVGDGLVESLNRPGGNVTGLSMANADLESKRIEILKEAVPSLTRLMILYDPSMGGGALKAAVAAAQGLGLEPVIADTADHDAFATKFDEAARAGANGLLVMASPFVNFYRRRLYELASLHRLPAIYETSTYVDDGGLLSYGPNFPDMYRRSAGYVAQILKGVRPADLPVEQPTVFELAINLQTARALGLTVPPSLLARADVVIE